MHLDVISIERTTEIQYEQVPVTLGDETEWRSIYYLPICDIQPGDVIQIYTEGQVRNDLGYNIELAQLIELKEEVIDGQEPQGGAFSGTINGWDFDTTIHYGRFSKSDVFIAQSSYDILYLVGRLRCRSTGAKPGDFVTVNAGQGVMYYIHYRPNNN